MTEKWLATQTGEIHAPNQERATFTSTGAIAFTKILIFFKYILV